MRERKTRKCEVNYLVNVLFSIIIVFGFECCGDSTKDNLTRPLYWAKTYTRISPALYDPTVVLPNIDGSYFALDTGLAFGNILKLDLYGNIIWQKHLRSNSSLPPFISRDKFESFEHTSDGSIIIAATTDITESGGDPALYDIWILKMDGNGEIEWQKLYGTNNHEYASNIQESPDGGYIIVGQTQLHRDTETDIIVLKLSSAGEIIWQQSYGGPEWDRANYILPTSDAGYIIVGTVGSSFCDAGGYMWILKLNEGGDVLWQKSYGDDYDPYNNCDFDHTAFFALETSNFNYIVVGRKIVTSLDLDADIWIIKIDGAGNIIWQRTYDAGSIDEAVAIEQLFDGGYVVLGNRGYHDDIIVFKIDNDGNTEWHKAYGDSSVETAGSIKQTLNGDFIVGGGINPLGSDPLESEGSKIWILKLDANGIISENCQEIGIDAFLTVSETSVVPEDTSFIPESINMMVAVPDYEFREHFYEVETQCGRERE